MEQELEISAPLDNLINFANSIDGNHILKTPKAFNQLRAEVLHLIMEDFPKYMAHNWPDTAEKSGALNREAKIYLSQNTLSKPEDVLREIQHKFASVGQVRGQARPIQAFPIPKEDIAGALEFEKKNINWRMAIAILQVQIVNYLDEITLAFQQTNPNLIKSRTSKELIWGILLAHKSEASQTSFMRELSPIMSAQLVKNNGANDEKAFAKALCEAFRQEAFRSQAGGVVSNCPFGSVLGRLSGVVFEKDEQSRLSISAERKPGAFFKFLMDEAAILNCAMPDSPVRDFE